MEKTKVKKRLLAKNCTVCGKNMKIVVYNGGKYRGGHFFGKIVPRGTEYWECQKCYEH